MRWFGWFRGKPKVVKFVKHPRLLVELVEGRVAVLTVDWPNDYETVEDKVGMGEKLAAMLFCLSDGQLFPHIINAVGVAGNLKAEPQLGIHIIHCVNRMSHDSHGRHRDRLGPLVNPDEVFEKS